MHELHNQLNVFSYVMFAIVLLINSYILKNFLKLSFKTALYRTLQQYIYFIFYFAVILIPVVGLVFFVAFMYPDFSLTYNAMHNLFSVYGFPTILHEGLSVKQLIWGIGLVFEKMMALYLSYYISCYVYERHIDASVNKIKLKKAMLLTVVIDQILWLIISIGEIFFVS